LEKLDALISWYVEERAPHIKKVLLLIDTKIGLQQKDIDMYNYIQELKLPVAIVLSKIDRLSKTEVEKAKNYIQKELFGQKLFPVSSSKKL
jgi:GTP-binding protein